MALVGLARADVAVVSPRGKLFRSLKWHDRGGEHRALFTTIDRVGTEPGQWGFGQGRSRYLSVEVYTVEDGVARLVRRVSDKNENCDADLYDNFIADSIGLTDLDGDGYKELTFAYIHDACVTDASDDHMKLLLLDRGQKHIVRANAIAGDRAAVDKQLTDWPPAFRAHARAVWRAHERN
jgi:hypothetical protein